MKQSGEYTLDTPVLELQILDISVVHKKGMNSIFAKDRVNLKAQKGILNLVSILRNNIMNSNTLSQRNFSRD